MLTRPLALMQDIEGTTEDGPFPEGSHKTDQPGKILEPLAEQKPPLLLSVYMHRLAIIK